MSVPDLSPDLKAFLFACIDTVEQMEMLALLRGSDSSFSAQEVGARLGIASASARHHLEVLTARGLLRIEIGAEARFRYAPRSAQLQSFADQLSDAYTTSRMLVLRLIAQNAKGALKGFAKAFKLRGDD